jgi:VWFA-related protein
MRPAAFPILAALLAAHAPAPAQEAVPKVRAELVQLDVVVTDGQGKLVRNLTRDDFQVFEDNKPQRIAQFMLRGGSGGAAGPPRPDGGAESASAPGEGAVAGPERRIAIVVDDLHVAGGNLEYAKQALEQLVSDFASPEDHLALVSTVSGLIQQFTTERAVLRQAIARLSPREAEVLPARGSRMTPAQAELILRGDTSSLYLAARTMIDDPSSAFSAQSPQAAMEGAGGGGSRAGLAERPEERAAAKEAERQARSVLAEALRFSSGTLNVVEDVLRSMARAPGRKICVLVSDGFLVGASTSEERTFDLQRVVDAATRSGAVVYSLDTHGLVPTGGDAAVASAGTAPGLQARVDRQAQQLFRETLSGLAGDTGGFLIQGTNDLAGGLRRMLEDNDSYYLMAYEPSNTKRDGRFRRITVRLPGRRNLTVRTRKGYLAPDDRKLAARPGSSVPARSAGAAAAARDALDEGEARAALATPLRANDIPVRLAADYLQIPPAGPQAIIRAHVDLGQLRWEEADGRRRASVELAAGVYDADGKLVGAPSGKVAELDLGPAEYQRAAATGLQYQQQVALPPGRYQVRLVARERRLVQAGAAAEWVEIPDLNQKKLALSSVFLSTSAPAAGPVPAGDRPRDAGLRRRFKPGDDLYFQVYVYNPLVDDKGDRDVVLQAQIWSGGSAVAASKPKPVALQTWDGAPVPETNEIRLEGLTTGRYELRVVVVDRKANATVSRKMDFTVE